MDLLARLDLAYSTYIQTITIPILHCSKPVQEVHVELPLTLSQGSYNPGYNQQTQFFDAFHSNSPLWCAISVENKPSILSLR